VGEKNRKLDEKEILQGKSEEKLGEREGEEEPGRRMR
jgi:hypothetical protein